MRAYVKAMFPTNDNDHYVFFSKGIWVKDLSLASKDEIQHSVSSVNVGTVNLITPGLWY